jgi:hypothetical protein
VGSIGAALAAALIFLTRWRYHHLRPMRMFSPNTDYHLQGFISKIRTT